MRLDTLVTKNSDCCTLLCHNINDELSVNPRLIVVCKISADREATVAVKYADNHILIVFAVTHCEDLAHNKGGMNESRWGQGYSDRVWK